MRILKQSHSAKKFERFWRKNLTAILKKLETFKNFQKKSHSAEKNRKGDPFQSLRWVSQVLV